jgi:hypothetical protein
MSFYKIKKPLKNEILLFIIELNENYVIEKKCVYKIIIIYMMFIVL